MADPSNPTTPSTPDASVEAPSGPNKGQVHGGQQGGLSADLQNNQATAVRSSGDQNPGDTCLSDRDRADTPSTTPGTGSS